MLPLNLLVAWILAAPGGASDAKLEKAVEKAIEKGAEWLKADLSAHLGGKGEPPEFERSMMEQADSSKYLKAIALLHAGLSADDEMIKRTWRDCEREKILRVYDVSLRLMFCEALLNAKKAPGWLPRKDVEAWVATAAQRLAAGCIGGCWSYGVPDEAGGRPPRGGYALAEAPPEEAPKRKPKRRRRPGKDEEGNGKEASPEAAIGGPRLRATAAKAQGDLSNAQYALLGLKAASLCKARPKDADLLWRVVAQFLLDAQEPEGPEAKVKLELMDDEAGAPWLRKGYDKGVRANARGWGYGAKVRKEGAYGSMTSCGVCGLLLARSEIADLSPEEAELLDAGIRDGVAWLARNFSVEKNPFGTRCDSFSQAATHYHLYGLERTGMLGNLRTMDGHDWHKEGAKVLLAAQMKDGGWPAGEVFESRGVRVAFALLFLSKATPRSYAAPYKLEGDGKEPASRPEPEGEKEPEGK